MIKPFSWAAAAWFSAPSGAFLLFSFLATGNPAWSAEGICSATAKAARTACKNEVKGDYWITLGNCLNISDPDDNEDCLADAKETRAEDLGFCGEQHDGRLDLCAVIGEAAYEPAVTPLTFGNGAVPLFDPDFFPENPAQTMATANPYFPLVPGLRWVYELRDGDEVVEQVVVTVEEEVKSIGGVNCLTIRDIAREGDSEDDPILEDTDDWYAQDMAGNVWYCGEISQNFEIAEDDPEPRRELVDVDGSWKGFRDYAQPGIIMLADPAVGDVYRQELSLGNAEDAAEVISVTDSESVPVADCDGTCVVTFDFTPLDPEALEYKYYTPGVGLMLEVDIESGDRLELVEFNG